MEVTRLGFTPLKGARHESRESVVLAATGAVGDRVFCLVDLAARRCLRTVENPGLLQASVAWDGTTLALALPTGSAQAQPRDSGEVLDVDYWGRQVRVEMQDGPWAALFSAHLGREVALVSAPPGQVVYGGAVTMLTGASVRALAARLGAPVDSARFRATIEVDAPDLTPYAEDAWVGRRLRVGTAELTVTGLVPRCAVIDVDPGSGVRDLKVLAALADERRGSGGLTFGVEAEVAAAGVVCDGDGVVPA